MFQTTNQKKTAHIILEIWLSLHVRSQKEVSAEDFVWFSRLIPRLLRILHLPPYGVWIWFSISKFCYHGAMFQRLTQMTHCCSFKFLRSLCPSCVDSMVDYMIKSWVVCTKKNLIKPCAFMQLTNTQSNMEQNESRLGKRAWLLTCAITRIKNK